MKVYFSSYEYKTIASYGIENILSLDSNAIELFYQNDAWLAPILLQIILNSIIRGQNISALVPSWQIISVDLLPHLFLAPAADRIRNHPKIQAFRAKFFHVSRLFLCDSVKMSLFFFIPKYISSSTIHVLANGESFFALLIMATWKNELWWAGPCN